MRHLHLTGPWPQKRHAVGRGAGPSSGRSRRASTAPPGSSSPFPCSWLRSASGDPTRCPLPARSRSSTRTTAVQFATDFATANPDRSPGTLGQRDAADWVEEPARELRLLGRAADVFGRDPRLGHGRADQPRGGAASHRADSFQASARNRGARPPRQHRHVTRCRRQCLRHRRAARACPRPRQCLARAPDHPRLDRRRSLRRPRSRSFRTERTGRRSRSQRS